jgi:hypothetical protein
VRQFFFHFFSNMAFDQAEFVKLLTDYYEFCNRVFWDDSVVAEAPNNGWPSITQSTMANLHKNDAAIELLRHMPFVDFEPGKAHDKVLVMLNTRIQDYRSDKIQDHIRNGDLEYYVEPVLGKGESLSPSCICFGNSNGRNGYFLVIDTADGYVYWGDPGGQGAHDEPEPELNAVVRERYAGNEAERWRTGFNVYRPSDFFALCKQRFRELRWIGIGTNELEAVRMNFDFDEADDEFLSLVRKMRRAGWPGDGEGRDWDRAAFHASLNEDSDEEDVDAAQE